MRAVAALSVLLVPLLAAQTATHPRKKAAAKKTSAATADFPIVSLTVEGNKRIPADAVLAMSGLKVGDAATKEAFDAAQHKIQDSGFFDRVDYGYGPVAGSHPGYAGKFTVVEASPLYKVEFAGFPAKSEELAAYMKTRDPFFNGYAPPTQQIIDRWAKYLDAWTAAQNHPKKVIGKLLSTASGDYIIQFQPDEPLPAVARVEFTGNEAIDTRTLQNTIGSVAYGLPYSEQSFREFLDHQLKPIYESKGLLAVKFEVTSVAPVPPPVKGVLVNLKVTEGPVYKLGKVNVTGVDAEQKDHLVHIAGLKSGEPANFDQINAAGETIKKAVRRVGYFHVATSLSRKMDDSNKKVDVTFNVDKGEQYTFGSVTIQGLDLNGTAAVQKQWGKKPGDAYNPDYPDYFLSQVKDEGIFDHLGPTRSTVKMDDERHVVDVTLIFLPEEKNAKKDRDKAPAN